MILREVGELLKGVHALFPATVSIAEEIPREHATVSTRAVEGQLATLEQLHEVRSRDVQEIRGLLCGELGVDGNEGDCISFCSVPEQLEHRREDTLGQHHIHLRTSPRRPHMDAARTHRGELAQEVSCGLLLLASG